MPRRQITLFSFVLFLGPGALVAAAADDAKPLADPKTVPSLFSKAISPVVEHFVRDISRRYSLDKDQSRTATELLQQIVRSMLQHHETELDKLLLEVVTYKFTDQIPTTEQIQDWAKRAAPIFEDFKAVVQKSSEAFHECLNDEQKQRYEADWAELNAKFPDFEQKLAHWRKGEFKPEDWFFNIQQNREVPTCEPERTWYGYTRKFVRSYELDSIQTISAHSILKELAGRAAQMRASRSAELKPIDDKIGLLMAARPLDIETLQKMLKQRQEVLQPINDLFSELKERLGKLPSEAQKAKFTQKMKDQASASDRVTGQSESASPAPNPPAEK